MNRVFKWCWLVFFVPSLSVFTQELTIKVGSNSIPATKVEDAWTFKLEGVDYIIVRATEYGALSQKLEEAKAQLENRQAIIAAKDTMIASCQAFRSAAETHVATLNAANQVCDSLYRGYKALYQDCKELVGLTSFGFAVGAGWTKWGGEPGRVGISAGAFLDRFELLGLVGDGHWGIVGTVRWNPFSN